MVIPQGGTSIACELVKLDLCFDVVIYTVNIVSVQMYE